MLNFEEYSMSLGVRISLFAIALLMDCVQGNSGGRGAFNEPRTLLAEEGS